MWDEEFKPEGLLIESLKELVDPSNVTLLERGRA